MIERLFTFNDSLPLTDEGVLLALTVTDCRLSAMPSLVASALAASLLAFHLIPGCSAQILQCATFVDGCDAGSAYEAAVTAAIARFDTTKVYGGRLDTFASSLSSGALASVSYSCLDTSAVPPLLAGSSVQSL